MKKTLSKLYGKIEDNLAGSGIERYRIVRKINRYFKSRLKSSSVVINGYIIFLDPNDSLRISINRSYEKFPLEIARKEIKKGDVVLDLGANIGYHTINFSRMVGENGKIFSFEPEPNNFELLKKNVEVNNCKNVTLVKKAVSNKNGRSRLYLSEENTADNRTFNSGDDRKFIEIDEIKLDDYFKNFGKKINFIKMNIQGSEIAAIEGMKNIITKQKQLKILFEFTPYLHKLFGTEPRELLELFGDLNFKLYSLDRKKRSIHPSNIIDLLTKYTPKKENTAHLLCVKG